MWEKLGAEQFLFNPLSGQTHILNPLGALILEALSETALSAPQMLDLLVQQQSGADQATLRRHLDQHLLQLEELGLIERTS